MAVLPAKGPAIQGIPGIDSPLPKSYFLAQAAAWREAGFGQLITTGTTTGKTVQVSSGALLNIAGPIFPQPLSVSSTAAVTNGNITVTGVVTANAPAALYYVFATYTAAGIIESLPGAEFAVSCAAGYTFSVNVLAAGAPAAATNFAAYVSTYEGGELLQQATKTTTALGTAFTIPYPLTNSVGVNQAPTNATGNIVGIAMHDSQSLWATGVGGGFTAGGITNLLGAWMPPPTLGPVDPAQALFVSLINSQPFEISLLQPWSNGLIGSTAGILLDASGWHVADNTQANKVITIAGKATGVSTDVGQVNDTYVRVLAFLNTGAI